MSIGMLERSCPLTSIFHTTEFSGRRLGEADLPGLQAFFEANPAYFLSVCGEPPAANEAHQEFDDRPPPEMPFDDAFLLGVFDHSGQWVAMASIVSNLLAPHVWHIGLFMVATPLHGSGVATRVITALEAWLSRQGAQWMRLGVVLGNTRAERFWEKCAFREVRRRSDVAIGQCIHTLRVMVKPLCDQGLDDYLRVVARDRPE